jgi:glycosyltransferase involved in cell wall biosynthesis/SAM-dependent methyltransferase
LRILHVIGWLAPRYGGPAVVLPDLCVALATRGHDIEIVTTNVDGDDRLPVPLGQPVAWAESIATFHALSAPTRYLTSWSMLADLRRRVAGFDIVHIHALYRFHGVAAAAVARRRGVPYVIQAHGSLDPWHRARRRRAKDVYHTLVEDSIIRGASAVVCTSDREARAIRELGYSVPLWLIPNGIDAAALRVLASADAFPSSRVAAGDRVVTFLGRISAKKGVPFLVEAFARTATQFPTARLIIAGPDDEGIGRGLAAVIADGGFSNRVSFVGPVTGEAKRALLQRSDVFVLPSADESFGVAVAEAMAVGCPVVVSPEVAIEDVVRGSGAGLVVERDPAAIANAIATILSEPTRATAMGEAGRRAVDERFSWPIVAAQTEAMYDAVVSASRRRAGRSTAAKAPTSTTGTWSGPAFRCPCCGNVLVPGASNAKWNCEVCGWTGLAAGGIPILLPQPATAEHDELDHHHAHGHKAAQAAHFDRPGEEAFEIDRPHGTPRLYRFLLAEKFRRAVGPIRPHLVGASALSVCGGSGMDAEFLARAGASVTTSDLSLGAATRAKARSEQYGLGIQSIVADVEHLPFADQSVDLVAVHDGLHHLDEPHAGLSEMARVARRWVVVTEPARASITRLAVRLGLALETEGAGNRVARMESSEVAAFLEARGYVVLRAERFAMYYPHHPGAVFRLLSRPFVFPIVRVGWRLGNALLGRFGNKMVVVAERAQSAATDSQSPLTPSPIRSTTIPSKTADA